MRNDAADVDELLERAPDRVVVSPGPCTPDEAGISVEVMRRFPEAGVPTLGVCLGHQSLAQAFGGTVVRHVPVHGKTTEINHDGDGLFAGLPTRSPSAATTRSSSTRTLPDVPARSPRSGGGVLMALRHRELPPTACSSTPSPS